MQGSKATIESTSAALHSLTESLISDPTSPTSRGVVQRLEERLSTRNTLANDPLPPRDEYRHKTSSGTSDWEEYSELSTGTLHDLFYSSSVLPCTCLVKGNTLCLSNEYVCALRLDGDRRLSGGLDHCFFDSVIAPLDYNINVWTPVRFHLPRLVVPPKYTRPDRFD